MSKLTRILHLLGVFRLLRWINRNKVIIIYLHGVADPGPGEKWRPLRLPHSASLFERQLEIIARNYSFVSIDDAVAMIAGDKDIEPYSVVLTFDDGYRNNMTEALPLARERGIKPTFYIATGFANNRKPFWFDRFDYVVQQITEPVSVSIADKSYEFVPGDRERQAETYSQLRNHAKAHFESDQEFARFFDECCSTLERQFGQAIEQIQQGDKWCGTLDDSDLHSIANSNEVSIGSHTVDHIRMDKMPAQECHDQLLESRQYLETATGMACEHFCYPNGSFNDAVSRLVEDAGYASAVTTAAGFNSPGDDLFQLHRFHLPDHADESRILAMLSGFYLLRDNIRRRISGKRSG